jgi:hypothetical protein
VRYYLEQRDPEFEPKMAEILCVYRQVAMLRSQAAKGPRQRRGPFAHLFVALQGKDLPNTRNRSLYPGEAPLTENSENVTRIAATAARIA